MPYTNAFEELVLNPKARAEFFAFYDELIADCKRYGFTKAALTHAKNRKRIWDEVTLLD